MTDITPLNEDGTLVTPHVDHKGMKYKYENICKVCGKTFYTNFHAADCCSKECLSKLNQQCMDEIKETELLEAKKQHEKERREKAKKKTLQTSKNKPKKMKHESNAYTVKNPKVDYVPIGEEIEDFYNSSEDKKVIKSDVLTLQGLYYRYRVAAKMFEYDDRVKFCPSEKQGGLVISKK